MQFVLKDFKMMSDCLRHFERKFWTRILKQALVLRLPSYRHFVGKNALEYMQPARSVP